MKVLAGTKVLVGPSSFSELDCSPMDRLTESGCEVLQNPFKRKLSKSELLDLLSGGVTGLIAGLETLDREVLEKSSLKVISRCGSGLSNVDLTVARDLGMDVYSTPEGPISAVAELTVGAMLVLLRLFPQMDRSLHDGKWEKKIGSQLEGKTVVILGFGRIGQKVAALLSPFRARILAVDPYLSGMDGHVPVVKIEEALLQADIVTIHVSGEACLLDQKMFSMIKPGAFVLNAARGGVIDETALLHAIDQGRVAGAWLDVFEQEPYAGPLIRYPQVILTPHIGSYTAECRKRMETEAVDNLLSALIRKRQLSQ